jgi:hypothetical protein
MYKKLKTIFFHLKRSRLVRIFIGRPFENQAFCLVLKWLKISTLIKRFYKKEHKKINGKTIQPLSGPVFKW